MSGLFAQWMGRIGLSEYAPHGIPPTLGSLLFYTLNIIICGVLLRLNAALTPRKYQIYIGTFLCTVQVCAGSLENGNLYAIYGLPGLFLAIFFAMVIYSLILPGWSANPVTNFHRVVARTSAWKQSVALIAIQAVAGLAAYRYSRILWYLEIHDYHRVKHTQTVCFTGLTVSVLMGFLLECGMTIVDSWIGWQKWTRYPFVDLTMKSAFASYLVTLGVHMTGMFYNPAMASCHFLGCQGTALWQHLIVYWLGPFVGVLIATYLDKFIHLPRSVEKTKAKDKPKANSKKGKGKQNSGSDKGQNKGKNEAAKSKAKQNNSGEKLKSKKNDVEKLKKNTQENNKSKNVKNAEVEKGNKDKGKTKNEGKKAQNKQANGSANAEKVEKNGVVKSKNAKNKQKNEPNSQKQVATSQQITASTKKRK